MVNEFDGSVNSSSDGNIGLSPEHRAFLNGQAITDEVIEEFGIRSVTGPDDIPDEIFATWSSFLGEAETGILFPWEQRDGTTVWQYRPDVPIETDHGPAKYVLPKGCGSFVAVFREPTGDAPVLLSEGTKQTHAALSWAPPEWGIAGMPGCSNWAGADLSWADGRTVVVLFDADISKNADVYDAAVGLKEALEVEGADEVVFARLAGAKAKDGLDDVLGRRPEDRRTSYIRRISDMATDKLGRRPAKRRSKYFDERDGLLAETLSKDVMDGHPCALTAEKKVAGYENGVYGIDGTFILARVRRLLGEHFRPVWKSTVEDSVKGMLIDERRILPDTLSTPLLNCKSGMLDLLTGELLPHDPEYLSRSQIPVEWDPDATCPHYDAWLKAMCPEQAAELEDVVCMMLDQSRTPVKAAFLFGPPRSGKSTFIRIIEAIAGKANCSAVDLHQLSDDKFMAAHLYGKMANLSVDPDSKDVQDIKIFKKMTGVDLVTADHKFGQPFDFRATALFAFSANNIPHVSDPSGAYMERIRPFWFGNSFAGHEDEEIERRIMDELPGILARWVRAWREHYVRGSYLPVNESVTEDFVTKSNRVARWVTDYCEVTPAEPGSTLPDGKTDTISHLFREFSLRQEQDGGKKMLRDTFKANILMIHGVTEVKRPNRSRALNVRSSVQHRDERVEAGPVAHPKTPGPGGVQSVQKKMHCNKGADKAVKDQGNPEESVRPIGDREISAHSAHPSVSGRGPAPCVVCEAFGGCPEHPEAEAAS